MTSSRLSQTSGPEALRPAFFLQGGLARLGCETALQVYVYKYLTDELQSATKTSARSATSCQGLSLHITLSVLAVGTRKTSRQGREDVTKRQARLLWLSGGGTKEQASTGAKRATGARGSGGRTNKWWDEEREGR